MMLLVWLGVGQCAAAVVLPVPPSPWCLPGVVLAVASAVLA